MAKLLSKPEYEASTAKSRDKRMAWWREARFGMFVHFGLYTVLGRHEWAMAIENWPVQEYEKLADKFLPKPGAPKEWARLAKAAGMKYMVLTTRHHEGFSLWDSKANPYNSVNYGPKRDIVKEFVEACREQGLRIGFYSSCMDWHHPDGGAAAYDSAARKRFNDYIYALNEELLTQYGKIDILWYDVPEPMNNWEGWNSLEMNQRLRKLQPGLIIDNRSRLDEDFGTPEEHVTAEKDRDWEACMTFNGLSWGYVDAAQVEPYSYNAQRILRMLATCAHGGGNLLLNIGPAPDGSVPPEAIGPLATVGKWLAKYGECAYGKMNKVTETWGYGSGICSVSIKGNTAYLWNWIWSKSGDFVVGGFTTKLKSAKILGTGASLKFTQEKYRIIFSGVPKEPQDKIAGVAVIALEFEGKPKYVRFAARPPLNQGKIFS
ncbi:alpha-L-fucosidase [Leadbettera azotonutricia]|uniref:alpha-L-fucosidase n=1 Tax=Leadbettera azotonutricia (strain ATCC BAA-888 / DSM 13862 / ZAS-9) TaxID=545695 RepID=F5YG56_LEAAZ|nr:alpha-L-fucosidase [Leadbettera azotonutricia]AEF80605.1 tissue alpha-L-fucosidase (Alpha-L-fucosidaseI) (Alpha-L-fucoside fucohydrolase) [Leadbettera azotonutricia ZAS-9]